MIGVVWELLQDKLQLLNYREFGFQTEADSDLCWDSVSLYQNEFDQLVSEARASDLICGIVLRGIYNFMRDFAIPRTGKCL